jgi:hypothetical protein
MRKKLIQRQKLQKTETVTDLVEDEEEHLNGKDHEGDGGEDGGQMEDQLARGGRQRQQPRARHLRRNSQTSF